MEEVLLMLPRVEDEERKRGSLHLPLLVRDALPRMHSRDKTVELNPEEEDDMMAGYAV